jgi:transglutaminase-like putative cysteine protease
MYERKDGGMKQGQKLSIAVGAAVLLIVIGAIVFAWQLGWLPFDDLFSEQTTPVEIAIGDETPVTGEVISREYRWSYDGRPWELTLQIPKDLYLYYRGMERAQTQDYSVYVTHPRDDDFIRSLADRLSSEALKRGFDAQEKAGFAASFVQSLRYMEEDEEYPRYPVEMLVDRGGDC